MTGMKDVLLFRKICGGKKAREKISQRDQDGRAVDYRFLEINPSFEKQSGLRDAVGKRVLELTPNIEAHWFGIFGRVALTGEPVRLMNESKALKSWFDVYAFRLGGPESRRIAILFTNITERKRADEALRESEERFHSMADKIPSLAWMADAKGSIFWYNKRWFDYTGTTLEENRGWGWMKVHHPDHVNRVAERLQHSWDTGEPWEDTFPLRGQDGTYRWFLSRAFPIRGSDGKVSRWFGTNTDITE
jgi:PAS domain S-box-containing protein